MKRILSELYADFLERSLPEMVGRKADVGPVQGKALAFIGMRRVGKTYLCYQQIKTLLASGVPKEHILYLNFEDDRLFGFDLSDCQSILDVFYTQDPEKKTKRCHFFFDEIQNIPNWERFIRRLMDTEDVDVVVTGSSAKLLSTEIATSLRGRSLTREVFPYSFEEYLRSHSLTVPSSTPSSTKRIKLSQCAHTYCREGGFPEVQSHTSTRRREIIQSYVDAVVLRDVVERHGVSNVEALRVILYSILRNPACKLSVNKCYLDMKSRGLRIGKNDVYAFIRYLTDAFLLFGLPIWTRSEKKRQVNPKKMYVIDNGILDAYTVGLTKDNGAFLKNLVYVTLRREGHELGYYETKQGFEVDFVYKKGDRTILLQASWSLTHDKTRERELRALQAAAEEIENSHCTIITFDEEEFIEQGSIQVLPLWKFLLRMTE